MTDSSRSILIVDDDPLVLRTIDVSLRRHGFRTVSVPSPQAAREALDAQEFDAVVADLNLPLGDGRTFAAALKEESSRPVVLVTGTTDFREVTRMLGSAAPDAMIAKPFAPSQIIAAVERVLAARHDTTEDNVIACEIAQGMARALEMHERESTAHALRTALWTQLLAQEAGLDPTACFWAALGALVHDVGKIGVPEEILNKPGSLGQGEWEVMKRHPDHGAALLDVVPRLARAKEVVLHHHECWNGTGYPDGLARDAIPIAARVFAIVDAYDSMTSDRPYRRCVSHAEASARIGRGAGVQFDPRLVDVFLAIPAARWLGVRDVVKAGASITCAVGAGVVAQREGQGSGANGAAETKRSK
ncbi:MAG: HD domain-containing phosphohydrolase [Sandaracinus sp.]